MDESLSLMNCEQMPFVLLRAADGELGPDERVAMEAHTRACPACHAAQEIFLRTDRALSTYGRALDQKRSTPRSAARRPQVWALAALTVLAAFVLALWAPRSRPLPLSAGLSGDNTQTIRVELPLFAAGDPFLDDAGSEAPVLADVIVGADGLPQDVQLAF
jgi:anti-sigma factor RsiW